MKLPLSIAAFVMLGAVAGSEASAQEIVQIPAKVPVAYPVPYQPVPLCPDPLGMGECVDAPLCRSRWFGSVDFSLLALMLPLIDAVR